MLPEISNSHQLRELNNSSLKLVMFQKVIKKQEVISDLLCLWVPPEEGYCNRVKDF